MKTDNSGVTQWKALLEEPLFPGDFGGLYGIKICMSGHPRPTWKSIFYQATPVEQKLGVNLCEAKSEVSY
jgi:hypothetical protein